ncbi:ABC transporter substrate-binding protein [Acidimangrovimonas pyrenivorans]|uniref:ABC transporter substrate-binding protein n=1 Tax=Acidimangrovimonas pyrenivorans TaxID=2030798 RepID=A0ABV7AHQ3_9RHOB
MTRQALRIAVTATALAAAATLPAQAKDLTIGLATAQTGALAPYDQPSLAGFRMGVDEINAAGGIDGKWKIKLITKDTRSDTAETALAAQDLAGAGIQVMITPCDADPSIAAGLIAQQAKIPTFSFCASTPTLPLDVGDYMFGAYPADNEQGTMLAEYAIKQGYKTAYLLVSPDSAYTLKLPEYFGKVFKAEGGKVVGQASYSLGQQDFSAVVTKISAMDPRPDVLMTSAYEPAFPAFIRQLRGAGVKIPVLGSDGIDTPTTLGLGKLVDGVVYSTAGFAKPGSKLAAFNARYEKLTGKKPDTLYIANGYDLAHVIAAAVKKAGSLDPATIRDAIAGLKDVQGVTGAITYAGTDRMPLRSVSLVRIVSDKRELVSQGIPPVSKVPAP